MGHGAAQRSLGIRDDDDGDDDDDDDEGFCQKWMVKLIFRGTYRLPRTWIVECLKIIDVGCNLKYYTLLHTSSSTTSAATSTGMQFDV